MEGRAAEVAGALVVEGQLLGIRIGQPREVGRGLRVQRAPLLLDDHAVGDVLDQRALEAILGPHHEPLLLLHRQDTLLHQALEEVRRVLDAEGSCFVVEERSIEDRAAAAGRFLLRRELIEARLHGGLDGQREREVLRCSVEPRFGHQRRDDLLHEERVAAGAFGERINERVRERPRCDPLGHIRHIEALETLELDLEHASPAEEVDGAPVEVGAAGQQHEQGVLSGFLEELVEECQRVGVGPLDLLEEEPHGGNREEAEQIFEERDPQPVLHQLRIGARGGEVRGLGHLDSDQPAQEPGVVGGLAAVGDRLVDQAHDRVLAFAQRRLAAEPWPAPLRGTQLGALLEHAPQQRERGAHLLGLRARMEELRRRGRGRALVEPPHRLLSEPPLAHPDRSEHDHGPRLPLLDHRAERAGDARELGVATE